ncbi:MAG: TlyA family rRNA (cytidine-2'-O)-methyltransferase [Planctomycetes bacterium]|jgi:23S rRNA (cytidine1920-2'-O)/16S rRNA (cytidine1409-2'-O)-methyltransferase|nr:TlyA family rRNA (cytidine-2'-O)-methyltransferase [Planctomycetota bacterium]
MPEPANPYASRGGRKLEAALDAFALDVADLTCADLGCSVGGFTDCLLQRGARKVFAVDTAYGQLAWKLRQDPRVVVMERTNALHNDPPPEADQACDLVVIDLGWTKQDRAIPVALRWLKPARASCIVSLIKPHYESGRHQMTDEEADAESRRVAEDVLPTLGVAVRGLIRSPIRGGKGGNLEHLALLRPQ